MGPLLPWPCPAAAAPHPGWRGSGRLSPMSGGLKTGRGDKTQGSLGGLGPGGWDMHPPHLMAQSLPRSTHIHMGRRHLPGVQGDPAMGGSSLHPQPTLPLPGCSPGREGTRTLLATTGGGSQRGEVALSPLPCTGRDPGHPWASPTPLPSPPSPRSRAAGSGGRSGSRGGRGAPSAAAAGRRCCGALASELPWGKRAA